jgi:hypothetical protein
MPFVLCTGLSVITIVQQISASRPLEPIVLVSFLPIVFLLVAQTTSRYISSLEDRIAQLEKRNGGANS